MNNPLSAPRLGIVTQPRLPTLLNHPAGAPVHRKPDAERRVGVGIVGRRHGQDHQHVHLVVADLGCRADVLEERLDPPLVSGQSVQHPRKLGPIDHVEADVPRVTGDRSPTVAVTHSLHQRTVPAARPSEHRA
jgi:hypothetical protein